MTCRLVAAGNTGMLSDIIFPFLLLYCGDDIVAFNKKKRVEDQEIWVIIQEIENILKAKDDEK